MTPKLLLLGRLMLLLVLILVLISIMKNDHHCCVINLNENDDFGVSLMLEKWFQVGEQRILQEKSNFSSKRCFLPFCAQIAHQARMTRKILEVPDYLRPVCAPFALRAQLLLPKISKIVLSITFDPEVRFRCSKMRFEAYQITFSNKWNELYFVHLSQTEFWKVHRVVKGSGVVILMMMK